jgi:hypothetical protein
LQESVKREVLQKAYLVLEKAIQEKNLREVLKQMNIINNLKINKDANN